MTTLNVEKWQFEEWLKAQEPDAIVGIAQSCDVCPTATWLKAKALNEKGRDIKVYKEVTDFMGNRYQNPTWLYDFIRTVDDIYGKFEKVTAKKALEILSLHHAE